MENEERPAVQPIEHLVAENVAETIWLRLRRLVSQQLCGQVIEFRQPGYPPEVVAKKAQDMSWAVASALGYWQIQTGALNAAILSRYYALLHFSMAEQLILEDPKTDLNEVQRQTEYGHGLFALEAQNADFPGGYFVGVLQSGHYAMYSRALGSDLTPFSFDKRIRKWTELNAEEQGKLISLSNFIRRVPELQAVVSEYLGLIPLSFHVGFDTETKWEQKKSSADVEHRVPLAIYPTGYVTSADELNTLGLPMKNLVERKDKHTGNVRYVGEFAFEGNGYWHEHLPLYKSGYCGTSYVMPFWGVEDDLFLLHLTILYAASIVVRYMPGLWHEIEEGKLNHIRALLEHYMAIVDAVLPKMVLERLTGRKVRIEQPGSLFAPT